MLLGRLLVMRFFQSANVLGVILTLYYRAHGLNYTQILSFEIVLASAMAVATVPLGAWADRHGRVLALKYANVAFVVGAFAFLFAHVYWQFVLSDLLYGVGLAWQSGADIALLAPGGPRWFSRYRAVEAAAGLAASLLAGAVLQASGMRALVVLNAVSAVLAGLAAATLPRDAPSQAPSGGRTWPLARAGWRRVAAAPCLLAWTLAGAVAFRLVAINLFFLDLPLWVRAGWHGFWLGAGVTILCASGWAALLAPALRARLGPIATLSASQAVMGGLLMALPLGRSPWVLTALMAAAIACQSWQSPIRDSLLTQALPDAAMVTTLSVLDLPTLLVTLVCELGVGMLADVRLAWAVWASAAAVLAVVPLWWVRPRRGRVSGPAARPGAMAT